MTLLQTDIAEKLGLNPITAEVLAEFARRRAWLLLLRAIAAGLIAFVAAMLVVAICDHLWLLSDPARWGLSLVAYGATLVVIWLFGWHRADHKDFRKIARQIETADPGFREQLLSAVELADPESANGSKRFRQRLQDQTARQIAGMDVRGLLPLDLIRPWIATATVVVAIIGLLLLIPQVQFGRRLARAILPGASIERASLTKILITKPSPPSQSIAEGDAVGVVASVQGANADDVRLQWRTVGGNIDELPMAAQQRGDSSDDIYSAILAVDEVPIEYRVLAGDGITLWHRLIPVPRPRIDTFQKRYVFPAYAQIPEQTVNEEHGDLQAIQGTIGHINVRFSEPCLEAEIRFVGGPVVLPMKATDPSQTVFSIAVPISDRSRYQVAATSLETGLENPPGRQYEIVPITDSPPVVTWDKSLKPNLIVSAAEVVQLQVQIADELPIDDVIQEFQVNDGTIRRRELNVPDPNRELDLTFDWDLMELQDQVEAQLAGGDVVRTRIVARDRRGQQSKSAQLQLLIADDGFAPSRHESVDRLHDLTAQIIDWSTTTGKRLREYAELNADKLVNGGASKTNLQSPTEIRRLLSQLVETADQPANAGRLELTGRAISDLDRKIAKWQVELQLTGAVDDNAWATDPDQARNRLQATPRQLADQLANLDRYVRNLFTHRLSIALIKDASALQRSLAKLLQSKIPASRLARHLQIVDARLQEIDQRFAKPFDAMVDSSRRLSDQWSQWRQRSSENVRRAIDEPLPVAAQKSILQQIERDLRSHQADKSIFNRQASVALISTAEKLRDQIGYVSDAVVDLANGGSKWLETDRRVREVKDSSETAAWTDQAKFLAERFDNQRDSLLQRLEDTRDLHSLNPNSDLPFLADLGLLNRAITNVTKRRFADYLDEPAQQVMTKLANAFQILEAGHEVAQWRNELRGLIVAETVRSDGTMARYEHPQWLDRYTAGVVDSFGALRQTKIDAEPLPKINHSTNDPNIARAKRLLEPRRYDRTKTASAKRPLAAAEGELNQYLESLQPALMAERDRIRQYIVPLHEQAREAAREVQEAIDQLESESWTQELAEADEATEQTMQALTDLANTQSIDDREDRELARDADAALAQINQQREIVEEANRNQAAKQLQAGLQQLRQRLQQTAEHFERAVNGEDISESRKQLRDAEQELQIEQELDQRYQQAEALANASQMDADELRKQLEQEAARNEAMRDELSDIARRTAKSALDSLRQSAQDESNLNQALESSDPEFAERTRHLAEWVTELAQQILALEQTYGKATNDAARAASLNNDTKALQQARNDLRDAAERNGESPDQNETHQSIIGKAAEMANGVAAASKSVAKFNESIEGSKDKQLSKKQRERQRTSAQRRLQNVRNQQLRALNQRQERWQAALRNASGRVRDAKQQIRSNEDVIASLQKSAENNPEDQGLKQQIASVGQRVDQARRFESAAIATVAKIKSTIAETEQAAQDLKSQQILLSKSELPHREAAQQLGSQLQAELERVSKELNQISGHSDLPDELEVPEFSAVQLAPQQALIRDEIDAIGNELRRAALNEQRLGRQDGAKKLADSATSVKRLADTEASQAADALEQTRTTPEAAAAAHLQIQLTLSGIDRETNVLARLLGTMAGETGDAQNQTGEQASAAEQAQQQAKQLAQTLDELDQANAQRGDSQSDQTAGEASPTLDQAKQQSARQAAQQRQQQTNGNPGEAGDQPQDESASLAGIDGQNRQGETAMPEGGPVSIEGIDRLGKDWGYLRTRRPGDASDSPRTSIPAEYRRQIETYFRAIAERSAEGQP